MKLSPNVKAKLDQLRREANDAAVLARGAKEQVAGIEKRIADKPRDHQWLDEELANAKREQAEIEKLAVSSAGLVTNIEAELKESNPKIESITTDAPDVENCVVAVGDIRHHIQDLQSQRRAIEAKPDIAAIKASARDWVAARAATFTPSLSVHMGKFGLIVRRGDGGPERLGDALSLSQLCWFAPEIVISRLESFVDEATGDRATTAGERAKQLETIDAELLIAEREEESLVLLSASRGKRIARRVGADIRAVLGVSLAAKASAAA